MESVFQENSAPEQRIVNRLGYWSSVLALLLIAWYAVAFGLYQPVLHAVWTNLDSYPSSFQSGPFLAWVIPCFLLAPCYLVVVTCFYSASSNEKNVWSLMALVFAVVYGTLLSANYYIQWVVVDYNLARQSTEGLTLWLFAHPYPHNIPGALEGVGYGFMSLSFLAAAMVYFGKKQDRWLQRMLLASGLTGLVVFFDPLYGLPLTLILVIASANALFLLVAISLWAAWFRRHVRNFDK